MDSHTLHLHLFTRAPLILLYALCHRNTGERSNQCIRGKESSLTIVQMHPANHLHLHILSDHGSAIARRFVWPALEILTIVLFFRRARAFARAISTKFATFLTAERLVILVLEALGEVHRHVELAIHFVCLDCHLAGFVCFDIACGHPDHRE